MYPTACASRELVSEQSFVDPEFGSGNFDLLREEAFGEIECTSVSVCSSVVPRLDGRD